jgi:ribosomal protein RSM22 (predicted rRNA methylase)
LGILGDNRGSLPPQLFELPMSALHIIEQHLAQTLLSAKGWAQYQQGDVSKAELQPFVEAIRQLSALYTGHFVGKQLRSIAASELSATAYALYYLPINAAKIIHLSPLLELTRPELNVLDFGSGPGTAALSLLASSAASFNFTCIDHSAGMRSIAQKVIAAWPAAERQVQVSCHAQLSVTQGQQYDIVCAANSLAELHEDECSKVLSSLLSVLAPGGTLLLLEPGQQTHTRRLMGIRDRLLQSDSNLSVLFPCTRHDACPMLRASAHDWCHGTLEWRQPPLNAQLDAELGFNKHRIKYSAFVFQRNGKQLPGYRVIIPPQKTTRGVEATLCGENFYGPVRIRKGERTPNNRPLEKASVFDRLTGDAGTVDTPATSCFSRYQL